MKRFLKSYLILKVQIGFILTLIFLNTTSQTALGIFATKQGETSIFALELSSVLR